MEKLEIAILEHMATVDLFSGSSPYLPRTFSKWRSDLLSTYSGPLSDFIQVVDYNYLPKYLKCVANAYHIAILNDPILADLPKNEESIPEIVRILTEWSIEIELAVDLIERSQLYKLYQLPFGYSDLFTELKTEWRSPETKSSKVYKVFLQYLTTGAHHAQAIVSDSVEGFVVGNILQSRNSIVASVLYAYFCSTFPWPVFALLGTQCAWIFSAIFVNKMSSKLTQNLEHAQLSHKVHELKHELEAMITDLMQRNETSKEIINSCVAGDDYGKTLLSEHFASVLSHKKLNFSQQSHFDEDKFIAEHVRVTEEDGWTLLEPPEIDAEVIEEWMVLE